MSDPDPTSDEIVTAIHHAFLMGWNLQELKSKVLLKALGLQPLAPDSDSTHETGSSTSSSVATTPRLPFNVDTLLQAVLPSDTSEEQGLPSHSNKNISRTSEWQAIFIRIASVHNQCFPASTTDNTLYDPFPTSPPNSRYPYLYPSTSPDYALIGIGTSGTVGVDDFDDEKHLGKFKLYDVTRRTLNCLNLLYAQPQESLLPDIIYKYQTQIVQSISKHAQAPGNVTPAPQDDPQVKEVALQDSLNQEVAEVLQEYLNETSVGPASEALNQAIKFLSFLTVRFLESWDGYLRENFYAGGRLKNNELELLAYEAGRSLSSLSWGISLMTVPLENALEDTDSVTRLSSIWMNVFKGPSINAVQRQISALGPVLDDSYYATKKVQRPAADERPNPDLPSNAIHAITYSLLYWQRAIEWICQQAPGGSTVSSTTAQAAIESTTTSTTVSTSPSDGTERPLALTLELSRQLRQALISQAGIWQALMVGEQTLRSFTAESVTKRILNDIMAKFENTAKTELLLPAQKELKRFWTPVIVLGILLLVILGGGIFVLAQTGQPQSTAPVIALIVGSALTLVSTALTRVGAIFSPPSNEHTRTSNAAANNTNLNQRLSSIFGLAGEAIVTAFQNAYQQILVEFDDLNHYVAISYPLIDFFIMNSPRINEEIQDSYIFLTKIAWTNREQRDEIERVARAAFGPLGALIGPLADFSPSEKSRVSASNSPSVTQIPKATAR